MTGSTISNKVTNTVNAGSAQYPAPLTITSTGYVDPSAFGATGVLSALAGASISNAGTVDGGAGESASVSNGGTGGIGVDLQASGTFTNTGQVAGGTGGAAGIGFKDGAGGIGVRLQSAGIYVTNSGSITGGAGGSNSISDVSIGGTGGAGVYIDGGTLATSGHISGGAGGIAFTNGALGDAVAFGPAAGTLVLRPGYAFTGVVAANSAANDVLDLQGRMKTPLNGIGTEFTGFTTLKVDANAYARVSNSQFNGTIQVADTGTLIMYSSVLLNGDALTNRGNITGQAGTTGRQGFDGVDQTGGVIVNYNRITGGQGGDGSSVGMPGGPGVYLNGGTLFDFGAISAGPGGFNESNVQAAAGTVAVQFGSSASTTLALYSGAKFNGLVQADAAEGDQLNLAANGPGTLTGLGSDYSGFATLQVNTSADWTLASGGTFAGPVDVYGTLAVSAGVTLAGAKVVVNPGASLTGQISADPVYLAGTTYGSFSGLGSTVALHTLTESANATWTIGSGTGFDGTITVDTGATLTLGGALSLGSARIQDNGSILGTNGFESASPITYTGGAGITLPEGGYIVVTGLVQGGAGAFVDVNGGNGGIGIDLTNGGLVINTGSIIGGTGGNSSGAPNYEAGSGGAGVYLSNVTFYDDGLIEGGAGGIGYMGQAAAMGDAVQFGALYSKFAIDPAATFIGQVAANPKAGDVLQLDGAFGTLNGLGTQFTGFSTLRVHSNASWVVASGSGFAGTIAVQSAGTLAIGTAVTLGKATLANSGSILGTTGTYGSQSGGGGGAGLLLSSGGSGTNSALILGGAGGVSGDGGGVEPSGLGGTGGVGLSFSGAGALSNAGTIMGGTGGYAYHGGGGGTGVALGGGTLTNTGTIAGGGSGNGGYDGNAGLAGLGVLLTGGVLHNLGVVTGAAGNLYHNGDGNAGLGGAGVAQSGGTLINAGTIAGGMGAGSYTYNGGAGVFLSSGTLTNTGSITGGGGSSGGKEGGNGGAGVYLAGGTLIDGGKISGGAGGTGGAKGAAGDAIQFGSAAGTLVLDPGFAFAGNVVANAAAKDVLELAGTAASTLSGLGAGIAGFSTLSALAGANWTLAAGDSFSGSLSVSGSLTLAAGLTLSGAVLDNGLLSAHGQVTLNGAVSGSGLLSSYTASTLTLGGGLNFAGQFSGAGTVILASTGTLAAGARLSTGKFVQESNLVLGAGESPTTTATETFDLLTGSASQTISLSGVIGDVLTNAGTLLANGPGTAHITASLVNNGTISVTSGSLLVTGGLSGAGKLSIGSGAAAYLSAGGALTETISGAGTLQLGGAYTLSNANITVGTVQINAPHTLSGTGILTGKVMDAGTVLASGGTLQIGGAVSGGGTLSAAVASMLDLNSGGTFAGTVAGAGTVTLAGATTLTAGTKLLAAEVIESANVTLASVGVTNAVGDIYALTASTGATVTLGSSGTGAFSNAGSLVANGVGTADISATFTNSGTVSALNGLLSFLGSIAGTGTLDIGASGTLALARGAGSGQAIGFLGTTGVLDLANPLDFAGTITGFGKSDQIFLENVSATGSSYTNNILTVTDNGTTVASLHFTGGSNAFSLTNETHGVLISFS